jgi:hypothetical protein
VNKCDHACFNKFYWPVPLLCAGAASINCD